MHVVPQVLSGRDNVSEPGEAVTLAPGTRLRDELEESDAGKVDLAISSAKMCPGRGRLTECVTPGQVRYAHE